MELPRIFTGKMDIEEVYATPNILLLKCIQKKFSSLKKMNLEGQSYWV